MEYYTTTKNNRVSPCVYIKKSQIYFQLETSVPRIVLKFM